MTSRVTVYATPEEMERLFDDTQGGFSIRYYEQTERMGAQSKFEVTVRHGDNIGYKDGETYDYQSFIDTFDDLEFRALNSNNSCFSETDMEMARKGLERRLVGKNSSTNFKNLRVVEMFGRKIRSIVDK